MIKEGPWEYQQKKKFAKGEQYHENKESAIQREVEQEQICQEARDTEGDTMLQLTITILSVRLERNQKTRETNKPNS
jgi:hypothetical protein